MESKGFVHLQTYPTIWEAQVVKEMLIQEGCEAYIIDQNVHYTIGAPSVQGYRLMVEKKNIIKAKYLIDSAKN